jgi:hypothetical protein
VPVQFLTAVSLKHHVFWDVTPGTFIVIDVSKVSNANIQNVGNYYEPHSVTSSLLGMLVPENAGATILRNIQNYFPQRNIPGD